MLFHSPKTGNVIIPTSKFLYTPPNQMTQTQSVWCFVTAEFDIQHKETIGSVEILHPFGQSTSISRRKKLAVLKSPWSLREKLAISIGVCFFVWFSTLVCCFLYVCVKGRRQYVYTIVYIYMYNLNFHISYLGFGSPLVVFFL